MCGVHGREAIAVGGGGGWGGGGGGWLLALAEALSTALRRVMLNRCRCIY